MENKFENKRKPSLKKMNEVDKIVSRIRENTGKRIIIENGLFPKRIATQPDINIQNAEIQYLLDSGIIINIIDKPSEIGMNNTSLKGETISAKSLKVYDGSVQGIVRNSYIKSVFFYTWMYYDNVKLMDEDGNVRDKESFHIIRMDYKNKKLKFENRVLYDAK